jgi:hypothetical protein
VQRLVQRLQRLALPELGYPCEELERAALPEHRRGREQGASGGGESRQTSPEHVAQARREESVARGIVEQAWLQFECPPAVVPLQRLVGDAATGFERTPVEDVGALRRRPGKKLRGQACLSNASLSL